MSSELNICVLGAGVAGLTTAVQLQKVFRNATITLIADKFYDKTTSYVAPALFFPGLSCKGPTDAITSEWFTSSLDYWNDLLAHHRGTQVGIAETSGYLLSNDGPNYIRNSQLERLIPGFRLLNDEELGTIPGNWKYGSALSTLVIENGIHLSWLTNKFLNDHGKIVGQKIENFSELVGKYDVVVNCTGIGARSLCNDKNLTSIRGQIYKVDAPWVDKFYCVHDITCIVPGFEGISLGTTRELDSFDTQYSYQEELGIKTRCETIVPKLCDAKILSRHVGFRPHRVPLRLEDEILSFGTGALKVVHNYGHSGNGVTAAPGTAMHAVRLVEDVLKKTG